MTRWGAVTREGRQPVGPVKVQWIETRAYCSEHKLIFLTDQGLVMGLKEGDRVRVHYRYDNATGSGFWVGDAHNWSTNR